MIKFEVRISGRWSSVDRGIILGDGKRLAYWHGSTKGIAFLSDWRLAESTIQNPAFKVALWLNGLSEEEKTQAIARRSAKQKLAS